MSTDARDYVSALGHPAVRLAAKWYAGGCGRPGCGLCGDVQEVTDVSEPITPQRMMRLAELRAHDLFDLDDLDAVGSQLRQLKADNPVLHALVKHQLIQLMQEVTVVEKKGVCTGEGEAPKTQTKSGDDKQTSCCGQKASCGNDTASKAAEAASTPPKPTK